MNLFISQDPSSGFYCHYFFNNFGRRLLLLNAKFLACLRITQAHSSKYSNPRQDLETYIEFLANIRAEVEDVMAASGLNALS
jgi:hypothetical protein